MRRSVCAPSRPSWIRRQLPSVACSPPSSSTWHARRNWRSSSLRAMSSAPKNRKRRESPRIYCSHCACSTHRTCFSSARRKDRGPTFRPCCKTGRCWPANQRPTSASATSARRRPRTPRSCWPRSSRCCPADELRATSYELLSYELRATRDNDVAEAFQPRRPTTRWWMQLRMHGWTSLRTSMPSCARLA